VSLTEALLENPIVYRMWQAPFANRKLAPVFAHTEIKNVRRVLDVGCGPGTNAPHFKHTSYLGIDFNPDYIENARRRFPGEFVVADVTNYKVKPEDGFDFILVNSILHHIDDRNTENILEHLATLLTPDGYVHILELVDPEKPGLQKTLVEWDRGKYARTTTRWKELFSRYFDPVAVETYTLNAIGLVLWNMIYFKGRVHR
jgi:SAM-dependent methyltransferase